MKIFCFLFILIGSYCCSHKIQQSNVNYEPCNELNAIKKAKDYLKQKKLYNKGYVSEVKDLVDSFVVIIIPESANKLGGGGKFVISKDRCEIIDSELYQ